MWKAQSRKPPICAQAKHGQYQATIDDLNDQKQQLTLLLTHTLSELSALNGICIQAREDKQSESHIPTVMQTFHVSCAGFELPRSS